MNVVNDTGRVYSRGILLYIIRT